MEYVILMKEEINDYNRRFNEIKKWFCRNINIVPYFFNKSYVNLNKINNDNFYVISENIFPLLCSKSIDIGKKSYSIEINKNRISYVSMNKSKNNRNFNPVSYDKLLETLKKIPRIENRIIKKFSKSDIFSKLWFYIDNNDIPDFLHYLENNYFTWSNINHIKLKVANKYKNVIYYDGKNKLESKKLIENMGINTPKTYIVFNNVNEITQDILDKYKYYIIKPTNLDGGNKIFVNNDKDKININILRSELKNFTSIKSNKELMPLINKYCKPKIIMEEYIKDLDDKYSKPCEFKFYLFNGKIVFFLAINRKKDMKKFDFYDENFNKISNKTLSYSRNEVDFDWKKPEYFEELKRDVLNIYKKFNNDLLDTFIGRFIRIDFFINNSNYYFGEFSLFPNGGSGNNLNEYGKKYFIKQWLPEVFSIFENNKEEFNYNSDESLFEQIINLIFS